MSNRKTEVMLQFPMMSYAYRVQVSRGQLFYLKATADWITLADGTVAYRPKWRTASARRPVNAYSAMRVQSA